MKLTVFLMVGTVFLLKSCDTTATDNADNAQTVVQATQKVVEADSWSIRLDAIYNASCDIAVENIREVRDWFSEKGELTVDDAVIINEKLTGENSVIDSLNRAHAAEKIIDSDDLSVANGSAAINVRVSALEKKYNSYIVDINNIFNLNIPAKTCGANEDEFCYDVKRTEILNEIVSLSKFETTGGDQLFIQWIAQSLKFIYPLIKSVHANKCKTDLKSVMSEQSDRLNAISQIDLVSATSF